MFKSIISAEVNIVWTVKRTTIKSWTSNSWRCILYNGFSHVVSHLYNTYISTNKQQNKGLIYPKLQWELWNFKNKPWHAHGGIVLFPRLNNCKFSENVLISFKWQRNFAKCVKVSFVPFVKEERVKNCNLAKRIIFKLE